jgi:DNA-directed RNA polymerase specialized sigma24 family protein
MGKEILNCARHILEEILSKRELAVILNEISDNPVSQIELAKQLGVVPATVAVFKFRAIQKLRNSPRFGELLACARGTRE